MLVLSRMRNEVILIGDDVKVLVVDIRGDKVRLGISAPSEIAIDRLELREKKNRDKENEGKSE